MINQILAPIKIIIVSAYGRDTNIFGSVLDKIAGVVKKPLSNSDVLEYIL